MSEAPKAKPKKGRALAPTGNQLPLWSERVRGTPNALARSATFTCADKKVPRRLFERTSVATIEGTTISYTGRELRQDDLTIWLQIAHLARNHVLGDQLEVTARGLATAVGRAGGGGTDIAWVRECIGRLREGSIWVSHADGSGYSGNFISSLEWSNAGDGSREKWKIYLDRKILALFQPDTYTLQNWEQRLSLTPAQQWLYGFFATHARPYAYKAETLHRLSGSTGTLASWKKTLSRSLTALKEKGMIADFIEDKRTQTFRVVHVGDEELGALPES